MRGLEHLPTLSVHENLSDRMRYGTHLQGLTRPGLRSVLSGAREVLREDDRHLAEAVVPERKGDDPRRREERVAALLDDPEKLRELQTRQIERREAGKAARRRRKGRPYTWLRLSWNNPSYANADATAWQSRSPAPARLNSAYHPSRTVPTIRSNTACAAASSSRKRP